MSPLISHLSSMASGNQIVGGGLILMLTGGFMALLRQTPAKIWRWLMKRVSVYMEVESYDPLFGMLTTWLDQHPYSKRARSVAAGMDSTVDSSTNHQPDETGDKKKPAIFSPALGLHVFWHRGRLVWLWRETVESKFKNQQRYVFRVFFGSQKFFRTLINEALELHNRSDGGIHIWVREHEDYGGGWNSAERVVPRSLDSVILPEGLTEGILRDINNFLGGREQYKHRGIPWHRGYLLHGVPGSGKTSLVAALAGHLRMDLYLLRITGDMEVDRYIPILFRKVRTNSIVLVEDIDRGLIRQDRGGTDIGMLLNCLDGLQSQDGILLFMTANHKDSLDPALLRPGRIDVDIEFSHATDDQILRMRERLDPHIPEYGLVDELRGKTMAEVQQHLLALSSRSFFAASKSKEEELSVVA